MIGMMNLSKYAEILKSRASPLPQIFADGKVTFQHNLAPCHNPKAVKKFIQENKSNMLGWPHNPEDMNAIENLWSILKKRLGTIDCSKRKTHGKGRCYKCGSTTFERKTG
jgi:transposase